jgi:hypothetical protein
MFKLVGLALLYICLGLTLALPPAPLISVANEVYLVQGGAKLSESNTRVAFALEQQVKRVAAMDPALDFNVTVIRELPDRDLLRILLLAVLGNFTTAQGGTWGKPCSLSIDQQTGSVQIHDTAGEDTAALKVLLVLLCLIQIRQWVLEDRNAKKEKAT